MLNIIDTFLTKNGLRNELRKFLLTDSPSLVTQINGKTYNLAFVYLQGYYECFKGMSKSPYNEYEIKDFLLREGAKWIKENYGKH